MQTPRRERWIHWLFEISVTAKGVDGLVEALGGVVLLFVTPEQIHGISRLLTAHELIEDPQDFLANAVLHGTRHLAGGAELFVAVYLLSHGLVKLGLVVGLLARRLWAYPVAIVAFVLFIAYQTYRWTDTHSQWLLLLTGLDLVVVGLTWLEYRRLKRVHGFK